MRIIGNLQSGSPILTVLVLTYNHAVFVEDTINSILEQRTNFDFSIIVHDDASTDDTVNILKHFQKRFADKITLMLQSENQFSKGKRPSLIGIEHIHSKYIALCEGDDYWIDEEKLQIQFDFMENNSWASLTHHGVKVLNQGGSRDYEGAICNLLSQNYRKARRLPSSKLGEGNFIMTCSVMIRVDNLNRELLQIASKYSPFDYLLFAIATQDSDIGFIDRDMAIYRLHKGNHWALMDSVERESKTLRAMWFLSGVLDGETGEVFRNSLSKRGELESTRGELESTRGELESTRGELESTRGELESTRGELESTRGELESTRGELESTRGFLREISSQLLTIQKSEVWRITLPLRVFLNLAKRIKRR